MTDQFIIDTIKKLLSAGVEKKTILSTLKETGLTDEEAKRAYEEASISEAPADQKAFSYAEPAGETEFDESDMPTIQSEKLDAMHDKMKEVHQKISQLSSASSPALQKELKEIKAKISALEQLMQKILENERKILNKL
jgi:DNA-binding transcriptional MerR regulator